MQRGRWLLSVVVVGLVLLTATFAVGACGSSGGSAGSDLKTYTDADYGYSFQYPAGWEVQKGDSADVTAGGSAAGSVGVFNPDGAVAGDTYIDLAQVSVYELNVTIDESMMPAVKTEVEAVLASLESQASDMKIVEALTETTASGMSGFKVTYSFSKNGAPATSTLYFLFTGNIEYQVTLQAASENWEADKPLFDALLASFKPGATE